MLYILYTFTYNIIIYIYIYVCVCVCIYMLVCTYTVYMIQKSYQQKYFRNQQRTPSKKMTLGGLKFQRNPLRGTDVSTHHKIIAW